MKAASRWKGALVLPVALAVASSCSSPAPLPARLARVHVAHGAIVDADGRTLLLRGVNVSGAHKAPPYFDFQQPADFASLRNDWAFNSVRFLVTWAAIEPQKGAYDEAYLTKLEEHVGWAEAAGLWVILDMHQDVYGEGFAAGGGDGAPRWTCDESRYAAFVPQSPWFFNYLDANVRACVDGFYETPELRAHYTEAWRHVAAHLASHDHVLGFDVMNEPAWGSYAAQGYEVDRVRPLYEDVVRGVRAVAPRWLAFLEPGASRNVGFPTRLTKFPFDDVVYSPHSYDRDAEGGAPFDAAAKRPKVMELLRSLRDEATSLDAALWVGEYGAASDLVGLDAYMDAEFDAAAAVAAGTCYWAAGRNDGGYSLFDASGSRKPALFAALVRPYPDRVAGTLTSYAYDDATRVLTANIVPDPSLTAPTEFVVPKSVYPNGIAVECGGCQVEEGDGVVNVHGKAATTMTLSPRP